MEFNQNSNSSLKSRVTKKKKVSFRVSLINRVLKPIIIPPQTLAKKKIYENLNPATNVKFQQS